jgi:hypothetical protein
VVVLDPRGKRVAAISGLHLEELHRAIARAKGR